LIIFFRLIINQKTSTCCRKETAKQSKRFQAKGMPKPTKNQKVVFIFERREIFEATDTVAQK